MTEDIIEVIERHQDRIKMQKNMCEYRRKCGTPSIRGVTEQEVLDAFANKKRIEYQGHTYSYICSMNYNMPKDGQAYWSISLIDNNSIVVCCPLDIKILEE